MGISWDDFHSPTYSDVLEKKLPNGVYLFQSLLVGNLMTPLCDNWQGSGVAKHDLGAIALTNSKKGAAKCSLHHPGMPGQGAGAAEGSCAGCAGWLLHGTGKAFAREPLTVLLMGE